MQKVFVTGATGFIGSQLVQQLLNRDITVRGLTRRATPPLPPGFVGGPNQPNFWKHPHLELVLGDITDLDSLRRGMIGCSHVFHLAAYAKNWSPTKETFWQMNVQGMRNVFQVAKENNIKRIVWTSSVVTFGPTRPGEMANEHSPRITSEFLTEYEETKTLAEIEALNEAANGFPLVIVNPTRVYGPGLLSEGNAVSQLMDDYTRGKAPFLPNRGINIGNYGFVDDIAIGHILAMERGQIGERYILGGENISFQGLLQLMDEITGKRRLKIPLLQFGPLLFARFQQHWAERHGTYPRITPGWVKTFMTDWNYSCKKAEQELGYHPISLREGLSITWNWIKNDVRKEK